MGSVVHPKAGRAREPAPVKYLAAVLAADGLLRLRAARRGRYAPSLLRFLIPTDVLRPERVAYHAHRDAERRILEWSRPRS